MDENTEVPSGVRELIERLRDDGVKAGREKASQVLQEAREEASRIVAEAEEDEEGMGGPPAEEEETRRWCGWGGGWRPLEGGPRPRPKLKKF